MNTYNDFERTIAAARGVVEVSPKQQQIVKANEEINRRRTYGYSGYVKRQRVTETAIHIVSMLIVIVSVMIVYAVADKI